MSDIMRPMPFGKLMDWILGERADHHQVFGVGRPFIKKQDGRFLPLFHEKLEAPFGPAAGPHTQLSQNIIASYYGGSRFFELKTVQILDGEDLPVSKPCIDAADECYNCEWSTELRVPQAFDEYVRAWYALKLAAKEFGLGDPSGFMFNMSVGYDLAGIQSPKIDAFIEGLKDASDRPVWRECRDWALSNLNRFANIDEAYVDGISPHVCSSITLSTLHGCPPQEIERIAAYLITEKKLNTFVKCNPTMLGYDTARSLLDSLGFDYVEFDDHHFKGDLQFVDAVPMFGRLRALAAGEGLAFGLKLSNTCPVDNRGDALPGDEMYMSGKALYPLTVTLAAKLSRAFGGEMRISFSGGADYFNIRELYEAGIWPITLATTLLKPGGYQRLTQIAEALEACGYKEFTGVDVDALERIAAGLTDETRNHKPVKPLPSRKVDPGKAPLFDCFTAPCQGGCPIGQDIPTYLALTAQGRYLEALEVIAEKNPLPFITGTICSHRCMDKCTRNFYEEPVYIRGAKLAAAEGAFGELLKKTSRGGVSQAEARQGAQGSAARDKAAVIGGGPAGLAAAYFLARGGVPVTVFEKESRAGGIVRQVIQDFRIGDEAIDNDIALVKAMGAEIRTNAAVASLRELRGQGFGPVVLAIGAWRPGRLELEQGESLNVIEFLKQYKEDKAGLKLGGNVAVIGGGNTAMDAARAAKRTPGVEHVYLVYRRDRRNMPADEEELALALEDGVEFRELLAPVTLAGGVLKCRRMVLGEPDGSGRRRPVETDEFVDVPADSVISAVGEKVDAGFYQAWGLELDQSGRPAVDPDSKESVNTKGVYIAGDGLRGPATVVEAIADAAAAAEAIFAGGRTDTAREDGSPRPADTLAGGERYPAPEQADSGQSARALPSREEIAARQGVLCNAGSPEKEGDRCLVCGAVCENCAQVCPNRANIAVMAPGRAAPQIVHIDAMCNECGNCAVFCPYESRPYKDKLTLFSAEEDFADSENQGFLLSDKEGGQVKVRLDGSVSEGPLSDLPAEWRRIIGAVIADYPYLL